jgi:hypothetical protein
MELSLERVLQALHDCGIRCGVATEPPNGISFWIDIANRTERVTYRQDEGAWASADAGARWMHERALALYPDCDYARRQRPRLAESYPSTRPLAGAAPS